MARREGDDEKTNRASGNANHGERRHSVSLHLEAQLATVKRDRPFDALHGKRQAFEAHLLGHVPFLSADEP